MKRGTLFVLALAVMAPCHALAETAKPETIEELLVVVGAQDLIVPSYQNIDNKVRADLYQALSEIPGDNEDKRAFLESFSRKSVQIIREEVNWDTLKPMVMRIIGDSFTQEELVGVLDLYKTPAAQVMINKMPLVTEKIMAEMEQNLGPMMQRLSQAAKDAINEAKVRQPARHEAAKPASQKATPAKKPASK